MVPLWVPNGDPGKDHKQLWIFHCHTRFSQSNVWFGASCTLPARRLDTLNTIGIMYIYLDPFCLLRKHNVNVESCCNYHLSLETNIYIYMLMLHIFMEWVYILCLYQKKRKRIIPTNTSKNPLDLRILQQDLAPRPSKLHPLRSFQSPEICEIQKRKVAALAFQLEG